MKIKFINEEFEVTLDTSNYGGKLVYSIKSYNQDFVLTVNNIEVSVSSSRPQIEHWIQECQSKVRSALNQGSKSIEIELKLS